jgi:hypothetical protein
MKGGMVKTRRRVGVGDKDDRLELHRLVLAEDDYSAQLSFQAESKDNLKYAQPLMIRYANTYSLQSAHG